MLPNTYQIGHYLESGEQIQVPPFQRPYEWSEDRLDDLWRDISHIYRQLDEGNVDIADHFMGVIIAQTLPAHDPDSPGMTIIDGQQRILTLLVLLAAIRDHDALLSKTAIAADNALISIHSEYKPSRDRVKPKDEDAAGLRSILAGGCKDAIPDKLMALKLVDSYRFFRYQLWRGRASLTDHQIVVPPKPRRTKTSPPIGSYEPWGDPAEGTEGVDLLQLRDIVTKRLIVLELQLQPTDEESGIIFETMNAKNTPLRQIDLIRNAIFVRLPTERGTFFSTKWSAVDVQLSAIKYPSLRAQASEQFLYEYLIAEGNGHVSQTQTYRRWITPVVELFGSTMDASNEAAFMDSFVTPLATAAFIYPLAVGAAERVRSPYGTLTVTPKIRSQILEIMDMSGGPAVPIIFRTLIDHHNGEITTAQAAEILDILQSYLVREMLAGETFSPLRGSLMAVAASIAHPIGAADLRSVLAKAGWKTNADVLEEVEGVRLNPGFSSRVMFPILRGIERAMSGMGAHPMPFGSETDHYSVEHVYPQGANIGPRWSEDLKKWGLTPKDYEGLKESLGNLTAVTNWDNSKYGRKAFDEKKRLIASNAPLKLHESISKARQWKPRDIRNRSKLLAGSALKRWPGPRPTTTP